MVQIMGIDPGSTNMGVSVFYIENGRIRDIVAHTLQPSVIHRLNPYSSEVPIASYDAKERIAMLEEEVIRRIAAYDIMEVFIEGAFYSRFRPSAYGVLLHQINSLTGAIHRNYPLLSVTEYAALTVRHAVGVVAKKGERGKGLVLRALKALDDVSRCDLPWKNLSEHAVDATAICYTGYSKSGYKR